jgi:hypothetical protein
LYKEGEIERLREVGKMRPAYQGVMRDRRIIREE